MTPVTVFTGFLGAGKTTIILNLIASMPKDYKIVLLKNEFGDIKVDSALAKEANVQVTEMMNGCLCCVLVGQMKNALLEIQKQHSPDRIIVETSGSAFPAPIAWQIREMQADGFTLDGILTVIDCVNFKGYEDTSYTAKMQAQYTDLILLNKVELVTEREIDLMLDHVFTLNPDTPKIKCDGGKLSPGLVFGLDTSLFQLSSRNESVFSDHHAREVDLIQVSFTSLTRSQLEAFLAKLSKEHVYRVKGLLNLETPTILNWAFERFTLTPISQPISKSELVLMGSELSRYKSLVESTFPNAHIEIHSSHLLD